MTCPVCLYPNLPYPPRDYHICPCCGTEFGNDDAEYSHDQLREMWIAGGARWFFARAPEEWNPWVQLMIAGILEWNPKIQVNYTKVDSSGYPVLFGDPQPFEVEFRS